MLKIGMVDNIYAQGNNQKNTPKSMLQFFYLKYYYYFYMYK